MDSLAFLCALASPREAVNLCAPYSNLTLRNFLATTASPGNAVPKRISELGSGVAEVLAVRLDTRKLPLGALLLLSVVKTK